MTVYQDEVIMGRVVCMILILMSLLSGCNRQPAEEVISRYPSEKKLETGTFTGDKPNRSRLKSFEYYESGERKKEFAHLDNHFFGPWTFWYKDGKVCAKGDISEKTMTQETAVGSGAYFWPSGGKMIEMAPAADRHSTLVKYVFDEQGHAYPPDQAPPALSKRIRELLDQWQAGKI